MAHDDIRVPMVPVAVEFLLSDGARLAGTIHLSSTSPFHEGAETLDGPRLAVRRGRTRAGAPMGASVEGWRRLESPP